MRPWCQAAGLDGHLLGCLMAWFDAEWTFPHVFFTANRRERHQRMLYGQAGLVRLCILATPNRLALFGVAQSSSESESQWKTT
jgi:hypothetical protein